MKTQSKVQQVSEKPARLRLRDVKADPQKLRELLATTNHVQVVDGRRVVMDYGIYGGPNGLEVK